jgi:hypothetical protein
MQQLAEAEALLSAVTALLPFHGDRAAPALRRCLRELVEDPQVVLVVPQPVVRAHASSVHWCGRSRRGR